MQVQITIHDPLLRAKDKGQRAKDRTIVSLLQWELVTVFYLLSIVQKCISYLIDIYLEFEYYKSY